MSDYVNREEIVRSLKDHGVLPEFAESLIKNYPAADVMPVVHAHWKGDEFGRKCSNCNEYPTDEQYENGDITYCPSCGALMDGDARK